MMLCVINILTIYSAMLYISSAESGLYHPGTALSMLSVLIEMSSITQTH